MDGDFFSADNIIFNGDPPTFYREILKTKNIHKRKKFLPEKLTSYSMGMFVLFFGTKKQYT